MGKEKFKIGDMVRHKNGGLTYEVIGTAYDLGWISLRGKLPFGGAEPFPCTNYDEYEIVPKHVVLSTANPDPNSWIRSFLKDRKKKDYAEELKRLSEQPIEGMEELKKLVYDRMDKCIEEAAEYEKNVKFLMMLQVSVAENMTLREAYEKFDLKREVIMPLAERYDKQNIRSYVSAEYCYKLVKFDEPHRIPNDVWRDYLTELYDMLIKKLGIEFI